MGFEIDEVSVLLQMSKRTIYRYVEKFRWLGNVETAVIGRPYSCIAMHPHEELVIMEVLLQHPDKTLFEIIQEVYEQTGSEYACSTLYYYLKRNNITRRKVRINCKCMYMQNIIIALLVCLTIISVYFGM